MSANTTKTGLWKAIKSMPQQAITYIVETFTRVFRPSDDNYPTTGTQPFEGEPAEKKHY